MERYSLIVVSDETAPIRRFDVRKTMVRRALYGAIAVAALFLVGGVDYVLVRIDHIELKRLRQESAERQAKIDAFDQTVAKVESELASVREFERKVRMIANLPGSAAAGGDEIVGVGNVEGEPPADLSGLAGGGIDVHALPAAEQGGAAARKASGKANAAAADDRVSALREEANKLGFTASQRGLSLQELVSELEDKHQKLASSPAVWPTKGWLTSRFGTRISPFTGKRQFHSGVDIAGARGTKVIATAAGKIVYAGKKGPMGRTVIIDHGYGIRTHYGHNDEVMVKKGSRVERGAVIAKLGNTGRSTGPHLHYTVEVKGKTVNPLDYIFD
jgi:murein DD-endopeptidase MepM/ murein hydrolase activator NlpD